MPHLPEANFVITCYFIKVQIFRLIKYLAEKKNECAANLLEIALNDIDISGIASSSKRIETVKTLLKKSNVFIHMNYNKSAIKVLMQADIELKMDDLVRKKIVMRESCGDLESLPYEIREKIASFI